MITFQTSLGQCDPSFIIGRGFHEFGIRDPLVDFDDNAKRYGPVPASSGYIRLRYRFLPLPLEVLPHLKSAIQTWAVMCHLPEVRKHGETYRSQIQIAAIAGLTISTVRHHLDLLQTPLILPKGKKLVCVRKCGRKKRRTNTWQVDRSAYLKLCKRSWIDLPRYLNRKNDGPPGNAVLWRGLSRLTDIHMGVEICKEVVGN